MHRAIETRYKGRRFRSRLEARWAIALDCLGVKWDYEPEGFELGKGLRYLPDFLLWDRDPLTSEDARGFWLEIKPTLPNARECERLVLVCQQTGRSGCIVSGLAPVVTAYSHSSDGTTGRSMPIQSLPFMDDYADCSGATQLRALAQRALQHAISARFEFGENGSRA